MIQNMYWLDVRYQLAYLQHVWLKISVFRKIIFWFLCLLFLVYSSKTSSIIARFHLELLVVAWLSDTSGAVWVVVCFVQLVIFLQSLWLSIIVHISDQINDKELILRQMYMKPKLIRKVNLDLALMMNQQWKQQVLRKEM